MGGLLELDVTVMNGAIIRESVDVLLVLVDRGRVADTEEEAGAGAGAGGFETFLAAPQARSFSMASARPMSRWRGGAILAQSWSSFMRCLRQ